jgi:hypothetical protein
MAATRAATAAACCLVRVQQWTGENSNATVRVLQLQWLQLVQLVLPEHSSSSSMGAEAAASSSAAAAAASTAAACSHPEMVSQLLDVLAAVLELDFDWYVDADSSSLAVGALALATQLAAALERMVRLQVPQTPEAAAAAAAAMAAVRAAAEEAETAAGEVVKGRLARLCATAPSVEARSALTVADMKGLAECLWLLGVHAKPGLYDASDEDDASYADSAQTGGFAETAAAIGAAGITGGLVEAAQGARDRNDSMAVPLQRLLQSLLMSTVKLAATSNMRGEWADQDMRCVLNVALCTAQHMFLRCQEQHSSAGGVGNPSVSLQQSAAPWLLLLAKGMHAKCERLQAAATAVIIMKALEQHMGSVPEETSRSMLGSFEADKPARKFFYSCVAGSSGCCSAAQLLESVTARRSTCRRPAAARVVSF